MKIGDTLDIRISGILHPFTVVDEVENLWVAKADKEYHIDCGFTNDLAAEQIGFSRDSEYEIDHENKRVVLTKYYKTIPKANKDMFYPYQTWMINWKTKVG